MIEDLIFIDWVKVYTMYNKIVGSQREAKIVKKLEDRLKKLDELTND